MRIPMELPEANEIATKDIIQQEVVAEVAAVHNEMVEAIAKFEVS